MREAGAALYHPDDKAIWLGRRGTSDGVRVVVRNRQDVDILTNNEAAIEMLHVE
jgi:hypothetical protein